MNLGHSWIGKVASAFVFGMALLPWSCNRKPVATAPPPPKPLPAPAAKPVPVTTPIPTTIPKIAPAPSYLEIGDRYFDAADYAKAAQAYEAYMEKNPDEPRQDAAMFRLALSIALPEGRLKDLPRAMKLLAEFVQKYPESMYRPQAELLLGFQRDADRLHSDIAKRDERIRNLSLELEQLKKIDIERRPAGKRP